MPVSSSARASSRRSAGKNPVDDLGSPPHLLPREGPAAARVVADAALSAYIARVHIEHFSMFGAISPAEFEAAYHRRQQERASPPGSNR